MNIPNQITESITSPASTVPVIAVVGAANWLSYLPEAVNLLTATYLIVLIGHKLYVWRKEWKSKTIIKDE